MRSYLAIAVCLVPVGLSACGPGSGSSGPGKAGGGGAAGASADDQAGGSAGIGDEQQSGGAGGNGSESGVGGTPGGSAAGAGGTSATGGTAGSTRYTVWPFDTAEAVRRQKDTAAGLGLSTEIDVELGNNVKLTMVLVPAGDAWLGALRGDPQAESDERRHTYTVLRPFLIGKTPLTRAQYNAVIASFPNEVAMTGSPQLPATAPYRKVKEVVLPALQNHAPTGWVFRLPNHDEWEYAARAGTQSIWYTGGDATALDKIAWYNGNSGNVLHDVGQKTPNAWGIHDMLGNAWHWVYSSADGSGELDLTAHPIRGCSFRDEPFGNGCRTSNRQISTGAEQYRFIVDLPTPQPALPTPGANP